jgi:hypothetical protein
MTTPAIEEYCQLHGKPLTPAKIKSIGHLRIGMALIALMAFAAGSWFTIIGDMFAVGMMVFVIGWFGLLYYNLSQYKEIENYGELVRIMKLIEQCNKAASATIENGNEYHLPCDLLQYIDYCLCVQEVALVRDIKKWNKLVNKYDNRVRSYLLQCEADDE